VLGTGGGAGGATKAMARAEDGGPRVAKEVPTPAPEPEEVEDFVHWTLLMEGANPSLRTALDGYTHSKGHDEWVIPLNVGACESHHWLPVAFPDHGAGSDVNQLVAGGNGACVSRASGATTSFLVIIITVYSHLLARCQRRP
jgi:hypothetical protein